MRKEYSLTLGKTKKCRSEFRQQTNSKQGYCPTSYFLNNTFNYVKNFDEQIHLQQKFQTTNRFADNAIISANLRGPFASHYVKYAIIPRILYLKGAQCARILTALQR